MLRDFLALHLRADDPMGPLFPNVRLCPLSQTGAKAVPLTLNQEVQPPGIEPGSPTESVRVAHRQAAKLSDLTPREAGERLVRDWDLPVRHATYYKAVFRPAVLRANRLTPLAKISATQSHHSLRHTYASLCIGLRSIAIESSPMLMAAMVSAAYSEAHS